MNCKIEAIECVDSEGNIHWVELEINEESFNMDREDIWDLLCIAKTVFDRMIDVGEAIHPPLNRKLVMNESLKNPINRL